MTGSEHDDEPMSALDLKDVLERLHQMLSDEGWPDLVSDLPTPTDDAPVRVAFVGPYNAGKSSLIAALTGNLSITRSAKPESAEATRYRWRKDIDLVDLPGWFSGFSAHDERADEDLRSHADFVAFVMTVELGDELVVDALEHVLGTLGFARRAVVVLNKSQTEDSDSDVVQEEITQRLGRFADVPVIPTDAQSHIDTISGEFDLDQQSIQVLSEGSGVGDLAKSLEDLVAQHRATARTHAQALQAARVTADGLDRLTPSLEEEIASASLDEFETTLHRARTRLAGLAKSHLSQLESGIEAIAEQSLEGNFSATDHDKAWAEAERPVGSLAHDADALLDELADDLNIVVSKIRSAAQSASAQPFSPKAGSGAKPTKPLASRLLGAMGINVKGTSDVISKVGERVVREGSGQGSVAYDWARKLQPKKKFAPHGRLKDAKKIHKGAKAATRVSLALPVIEEAWQWFHEQRETRKAAERESAVRAHYADLARDERERVQVQFDEWTAEHLKPFEQKLVLGRTPIDNIVKARERSRSRLTKLHDRAVWIANPQP